jgi:ATP-dependent DNA helicase DinG
VELNSALVAVAPVLSSKVFEPIPSCILTSATLAVGDDFSFFAARVGACGAETLRLASSFDHKRQALLYVASDLPLPTDEVRYYDACAKRVGEILRLSQGRALILFTSYKMLKEVYERCPKDGVEILAQGELNRAELLRIFAEDVSSVLFATSSFWQGVDVPGEALSCLIITRLPFDVPDEPHLEAILESYRDQGLDPFKSYQLPQAVLRLRQGFGRLIRSRQDRGVVCILDPRILKRGYGQTFIRSLPRIELTQSLSTVARFFNKCDG